MSKRTIIECDFCGKWTDKHDIHKFKETKYTWCDGWSVCKIYMCFDCKMSIRDMLRKKQRELDKEAK